MACYGCPYLQSYDLIWQSADDPQVICVMLWCCAGPELQVRRGDDLLLDEFFPTRLAVYDRAEQLREEGWENPVGKEPIGQAV